MATKTRTTRRAVAPPTLTCPECGKTFTRSASLGAHRRMTHGVAGRRSIAPTPLPRTRMVRAHLRVPPEPRLLRVSEPPPVDRDELLGALFTRIPASSNVLHDVEEWLTEGERLASLAR